MKELRSLWLIFSGRLFLIVSSMVTLRIATEVLGPTQMGVMSLVLAIISLAVLGIAPVGLFYRQHAVEWYLEGRLLHYTYRYSMFLAFVSIVASLLLLVFYFFIPYGTLPINIGWLVTILVMTLILTMLNGTLLNVLNLLGSRGYYVLFSNLSAWVGLLLAAAGTLIYGRRAEYWLVGLFGGQGLALLLSAVATSKLTKNASRKLIPSHKSMEFKLRRVFRFSWPLMLCTTLYWVQRDSYRLIMANYAGLDVIGLFTVNFGIGMMLMASFEKVFREYYNPIYFQAIAHGSYKDKIRAWDEYVSAYFPAMVLFALFVIEGSTFFSLILVSSEFHSAGWIMVWGILAYAAVMVYAAYFNLVLSLSDNRILIRPNLFGATAVLVLMLLISPEFPLIGTAIALLMGTLTVMISTAYTLGHKHVLKIAWRRMGFAVFIGVPLVVMLEWGKHYWITPTQLEALIVLAVTGIYFSVAQYFLARPWLYRGYTNDAIGTDTNVS